MQNLWLITNRHVALPRREDKELLPSSLTFFLRRANADETLAWHPITLDRAALLKRLRLHPNPVVDVAAVDVLDLVGAELKARTDLLPWRAVSREYFVGQNKINVEVADDVIVIGYPRDFYDQVNLYPVVKAGIIATKWGANFNGQPRFLIDAKLFPSSSGSLVVSKPRNFTFENGKFLTSDQKHYAFLGVLSSAKMLRPRPVELENLIVQEKLGYDLAEVWYAAVVEEIVQSGVTIPVPP